MSTLLRDASLCNVEKHDCNTSLIILLRRWSEAATKLENNRNEIKFPDSQQIFSEVAVSSDDRIVVIEFLLKRGRLVPEIDFQPSLFTDYFWQNA